MSAAERVVVARLSRTGGEPAGSQRRDSFAKGTRRSPKDLLLGLLASWVFRK